MSIYIVKNEEGLRLCKDGRWRDFANFGTYPECVKVYKIRKWAMKAANKFSGENSVQMIPKGYGIDASGKIFKSRFLIL